MSKSLLQSQTPSYSPSNASTTLTRRPTPRFLRKLIQEKVSLLHSCLRKPSTLAKQELLSFDFTQIFGPPCLNQRRLYTIYEDDAPSAGSCVFRVGRTRRKPKFPTPPSEDAKKRTPGLKSALRNSTNIISPNINQARPTPRPKAGFHAFGDENQQLNDIRYRVKPTSSTVPNRNKPAVSLGEASRRTRENAEVSAIRRRKRRGSRDELFSGYGYHS